MPTPPVLSLLRLILVVIGLVAPSHTPVAAGGMAGGEATATAPARLATAAPAIRALDPETEETTTPPPGAWPVPAALSPPATPARTLAVAEATAPASRPGLPPRSRGPPLA